MSSKLSRRALARYIADAHQKNGSLDRVLDEVAAYLIESGRTREAPLLVRTIESVLAERGTVIATATSARRLDDIARRAITALVGGDQVILRENIDESLIGGVIIETPTAKLDASIRHKIARLKAAKIS